ncbi:VCBS repeat-containing protein [bacterium]|nr:VCBS repeat-containing protein [bacterium]
MKQLTIISTALVLLTALHASCGIVTGFPYTESFENTFGDWSYYTKPYYHSGGSTSWWAQWTITNTTVANFPFTGPDSAFDGTYYIQAESLPVSGLSPHYLILTCDFSAVTSPELSFMYYMYGEDMGELYLNVLADGVWSNLYLIVGEQQTSRGEPWGKGVADISYCGGKTEVVLQFEYDGATTYANDFCALDLVKVYDNTLRVELDTLTPLLYADFDNPAEYKIEIQNFTGATDDFSLKYISEANVSAPATTGSLTNESTTNISVTISLLPTSESGSAITSIVKVVSSDFSFTGNLELITHCLPNVPLYAFQVYSSPKLMSHMNPERTRYPYWEANLDDKFDPMVNFVFAADFLTNDFSKVYAIITGTNWFVSFGTESNALINYIGSCSPTTGGGYWTDMTIAKDGTIYAVTYEGFLYTINPDTGEATFFKEINGIGITKAIAINRHNEMYAVEIVTDNAYLYKIDLETGNATMINRLDWSWSVAINLTSEQGLEFDDMHGILYWAANSNNRRELIIVDPETAELSLFGRPGTPEYPSFDGLAIALPTPGTVINGSFEYFNYTGWTVSGNGAFGNVPCNITEYNMPEDGIQYANSGYDSNGVFDDSLVGVLQSESFPLAADEQISMFVGGWSSELGDTQEYNYVSLHRAEDDVELDRVYTPNANESALCLLQHNTTPDSTTKRLGFCRSPRFSVFPTNSNLSKTGVYQENTLKRGLQQSVDVYLKIVDDGSGTTNAWISADDIETVEYSYVIGENCGFERGDFQSWTVSGTGWETTNLFSGFHGRFFASTLSDGTNIGVLRSASFPFGNYMSVNFLINGFAGSANGSNYVTLNLESAGTEIARIYPPNSSNFVAATLTPTNLFYGTNVYLEVIDNCPDAASSWIGADDFQVVQGETPGNPKLDFETGTYLNWTVSGPAWGSLPETTNFMPAHSVGFGCQSNYFGVSLVGGETAIGTIRSVNVTLTGNGVVNFLMCGWSKQPSGVPDSYNYVTLNRTSNGEELDRVYAPNQNTMVQRFLQSAVAIGEEVYIEAVDNGNSSGGYQWFGVDDFQFADPIENPGKFEDVSTEVGLSAMYSPAHVDNAIAWGDYNNDGWPDMYLGTYDAGKGVYLFKNNGGVNFENANIPNVPMWWPGVFIDYDNDGLQDIYSAAAGGHLVRNQGDGTFSNQDGLLATFNTQSECSVWADFNNDGRIEFYRTGWEVAPSGPYFPDARWQWNKSTSHFDLKWDQTSNTRAGRGVTCADFDEDGDQDIYVSNYRIADNYLWINDGNGNFTNLAAEYNIDNDHNGGSSTYPGGHTIGSCFGDLDNDGHLDLVVGNFAHSSPSQDRPMFYRNRGPSGNWYFEDKSSSVGLPYVESHASPALADFDNDGDLDFFITAVAGYYAGQRCTLMRNDGNWNFTDVSVEYDMYITTPESNFQAGWADYDNDGDLDIMTGKKLYRNNITNDNHWIKIKMVGDGANINRDAIGAIVRIPFGSQILTRQVESAMGWGNQNDKTLHFGLGTNSVPVTVITTWPDSRVQTNSFDVDRTVTITYDIQFSEISVSGNGYGIPNGDTTPSITDGTDFGVVGIDTFARKTFDIANSGNINLTISDILISDTSAFRVTTSPAESIAPGGSTTFRITFEPEDILIYSGTVSIVNNDNTANPYTFMIKGQGIPEPWYLLFIIGNFFLIFLWKNKK